MKRTVISHDVTTYEAKVRFEHNGVTYEDNFNLIRVVPGTENTFREMGIDFDKKMQLKALDSLTANVQRMIESGDIVNQLEAGPAPEYQAPPAATPDPKAEPETDAVTDEEESA